MVLRSVLAACACAALGACAAGAPPGFAKGEDWVIPLVGPLENGVLLVPALVNDQGPFVFAVDPDAHVSIIDEEVLAATKAHTGEGPRILDETDTQQIRFFAEILSWQLGSLTVKGPMPAQLVGKGTFDTDGRRVHGVIGRDIIADSLVFGFDRDAGVVTLQTQKSFKAPVGAPSFTYSRLQSRIPNVDTLPLPRRLVTADIDGAKFPMHFDLGATTSQLRSGSWPRAKLVESEAQLTVVDEAGILRPVKTRGVASTVSIGDAGARNVVFVPYGDRRWAEQDLEGSIGLDFFKDYAVTVNWDSDRVYLKPRNPNVDVATRIGRWQSKTLSGCTQPGCVKVTLIDPLAGTPPEQYPKSHPGLVASIVREPSANRLPLEVVIEATSENGRPLKWLVVSMPAGSDRAMTHLPISYLGATLTVVDASPFPRPCPNDGSCVDLLKSPRSEELPPVEPAPPSTPEPAPAPTPPTEK